MHVPDDEMLSTTPYEDLTASLRPTWLPVDPTTFLPPVRKSHGASVTKVAQIVSLLFVTWGLAFGSVVGSHVARTYFENRVSSALAASNANEVSSAIISEDVASSTKAGAASASTKTSDSGITLTVDVNDLPISKDLRGRKAPGAEPRHAAGS